MMRGGPHTPLPMTLDIAGYTAAQRQRLEEIRRATEKEYQLLALHAGKLAHCTDTTTAKQDDGALLQTPQLGGGRWVSLNDKAMELHALDEKLTLEEREMERQEFELERRFHTAERRKEELLSQLALLQHREALLKKQEEQLDEEESGSERASRLLDTFAQEMDEERRASHTHVNEKRGRLGAAKMAAADKQKKRDALESRTRAQISETQDRIREHRVEMMRRGGALNDKERWLRQEQSRLREEELAAIYRLRKEIDSMAVTLTGEFARQ
ncbi:hypothetical protein DQ04_00961060 [Trypanosoma grayi]|uniref:hypothetical protein n=1 Tax=Trypanosoma grayi TaxID=71804 RepID=UPI0004F451F6|nr:hypothetical protein DQ04_00961060 [Trypanosoma grayi]KEG13513.1 hypothetical protein DQ04_00961060 [Trypanosoma grayi]